MHAIAAQGTQGTGSRLPHFDQIQRSFGSHDISGVQAHTDGAAASAAGQLGARAYAHGNSVAFAGTPDLHTAAHEAAHVVQQRGGVQLKGGIDGGTSDPYEQHADAVADKVVRGESAESLLSTMAGGVQSHAAVQRAPAKTSAIGSAHAIAPPKAGVNKAGFIDHSDGANLRSGPAEAGGATVHDGPLPPATRVFVSGTHPDAPEWTYVTAFLKDQIVRGYVQGFRVTTELPEPLAKLHQVVAGDTAEKLAVQEYNASVRDGHDLRYYENVLLYVNKQAGRDGIPMAPAMALANGGTRAGAGAGVAIGPTLSPVSAAGAAMTQHDDSSGGGSKDTSKANDAADKPKTSEAAGESKATDPHDPNNGPAEAEGAGHETRDTPMSAGLKREKIKAPTGDDVEVVARGKAIVPTGKVELFPRGKVKPFTSEMAEELRALRREKQTARKAFDAEPSKAERLDALERLDTMPIDLAKWLKRSTRRGCRTPR